MIYYNYIYNKLVGYVLCSLINYVFLKKGNPVHSITSWIEGMLNKCLTE